MQLFKKLFSYIVTIWSNTPSGRKAFYSIILPLVLLSLYGTDPDVGLIANIPLGTNLVNTLLILIPAFLYIAVLHIGRKILMDYVKFGDLYRKALEHPIGAGCFAIGVGLFMVAIALVIMAATSGYSNLPL